MQILVLTTDVLNGATGIALLPLFKVVRLLRVVLVMTRLQRSRERYRRMKMVGLSAPVEKVFEIIGDLRAKAQHPEDDKALAWTLDLIAKEELYKVSFTDSKSSSGMHLTAEMTDWLRSNLQASLPGGLLVRPTDKAEGGKERSNSISGKGGLDSKGVRRKSASVVVANAVMPALAPLIALARSQAHMQGRVPRLPRRDAELGGAVQIVEEEGLHVLATEGARDGEGHDRTPARGAEALPRRRRGPTWYAQDLHHGLDFRRRQATCGVAPLEQGGAHRLTQI